MLCSTNEHTLYMESCWIQLSLFVKFVVDFLRSENLMKHHLYFTNSTKKLKLPHMTTVFMLLLFLGTYFFKKNSLKAHLLLFYRYIWLLLTTGIIRKNNVQFCTRSTCYFLGVTAYMKSLPIDLWIWKNQYFLWKVGVQVVKFWIQLGLLRAKQLSNIKRS